jgi:hypothetical protein
VGCSPPSLRSLFRHRQHSHFVVADTRSSKCFGPLTLRLRARECYDPEYLDKRWYSFCIVPLWPRLEQLEDSDHSLHVEPLEEMEPEASATGNID